MAQFRDVNNADLTVDFVDLSSGEKMIVTLILWAHNQKLESLNDLFIMDEPDAHLHPSMCKLFLKIVADTLVSKFGIQVILATHNPSTVALAPEDSLFVMNKNDPQRIKRASKSECLSLLTENLLLVKPSFRVVLVEDAADSKFYTDIYRRLVCRDMIANNPPLIFKPASSRCSSGGCTVVKSWVEKLNEGDDQDLSLKDFLYGVIDKDVANEKARNLYVLNRYSMENYLLDPIVVFSSLLMHDDPLALEIAKDTKYHKGNLHDIYYESPDLLSVIAGNILSVIEPKLSYYSMNDKFTVEFVNGLVLEYPVFLRDMKGHELHALVKECFTKGVLHEDLMQALSITGLIPVEIKEILHSIGS